MKSILFMYHASNIGGGTYCLLNILKAIDRTKYKPIVLLCHDGDLVKEIEKLGIRVYFMPNMTLVPYNKSLLGRGVLHSYNRIRNSIHKFEALLDTIKPDLVYLNTMMLAPYLKVAKNKGCKTIIHIREHWPLGEHKFQLSRIQNIIENFADAVIAINNYSASMVPNCVATVVYDWIDMHNRYEYRPFEVIFGEDVSKLKIYLFTGGLQDIKGAKEIVDTFIHHMNDENKRLLIVGVSPHPDNKGIKNKIRYLLSKIGIYVYEYQLRKMIASDDRIVCIPPTYAMAHIMQQAYCSLSYFTIPHANLAMAESIVMGTIPVAARTSESVEYSNSGELAVLFELGNQDDMINKLKDVDANYDKIKMTIAMKKNVVEKMFNKERNVAILESIFETVFDN